MIKSRILRWKGLSCLQETTYPFDWEWCYLDLWQTPEKTLAHLDSALSPPEYMWCALGEKRQIRKYIHHNSGSFVWPDWHSNMMDQNDSHRCIHRVYHCYCYQSYTNRSFVPSHGWFHSDSFLFHTLADILVYHLWMLMHTLLEDLVKVLVKTTKRIWTF